MATMNKDGSPRKKGSGRTKGSVSFVEVSLGDLNQALKPLGKDATILVGRKWVEGLEMVGIRLAAKQMESCQATSKDNIEAVTTQISMKVEDLDEVEF
tara:strand:+ start:484 stop:777 length:294 start_codon:yes stop_codon:yes gene_type:complete